MPLLLSVFLFSVGKKPVVSALKPMRRPLRLVDVSEAFANPLNIIVELAPGATSFSITKPATLPFNSLAGAWAGAYHGPCGPGAILAFPRGRALLSMVGNTPGH